MQYHYRCVSLWSQEECDCIIMDNYAHWRERCLLADTHHRRREQALEPGTMHVELQWRCSCGDWDQRGVQSVGCSCGGDVDGRACLSPDRHVGVESGSTQIMVYR